MNREEIIRLAEVAGLSLNADRQSGIATQLEKFATLVSAAEREACARLCEMVAHGHSQTAADYFDFYLPTEREDAASQGAGECVQAIRRRMAETGTALNR